MNKNSREFIIASVKTDLDRVIYPLIELTPHNSVTSTISMFFAHAEKEFARLPEKTKLEEQLRKELHNYVQQLGDQTNRKYNNSQLADKLITLSSRI